MIIIIWIHISNSMNLEKKYSWNIAIQGGTTVLFILFILYHHYRMNAAAMGPSFTLCLISYCCNIVYRQPPTIDYSCTLSRVERVKEYQWSTFDNSLTFNINVAASVCRHLFHSSSTLVHPHIVCLLIISVFITTQASPIPDNNNMLCELPPTLTYEPCGAKSLYGKQ